MPAPPSRPSARAFSRVLVASLVTAGLAGCAANAPLVTPPIEHVDGHWVTMPSTSPESATPIDARRWWQAFQDPALDALVRKSLAGNLELKAAAARLRAARALARVARLPAAEVDLAAAPQSSADGRSHFFQAGFDASWELDLFGRADANQSLASADADIASADAQAIQVTLSAELVRTYLEWRHAVLDSQVLDQIVRDAEQRRQLTTTLVEARQATPDDVGRAEAALAAAEAARADAQLESARCRERLRVLSGGADVAPPSLHGADVMPQLAIALSTPAQMVGQRPDIQRAHQQAIKAGAAVGIARADMQPRLNLVGALGIVASVHGIDLGDAHGSASAGPALRVPLFDQGRRQAGVSAREAEFDAAVALYRQAVLEAVAEVQAAIVQLEAARQKVETSRRGEAVLERLHAAADVRLQLRLGDRLALLDAANARDQAHRQVQQARLAQQLAFVSLHKAMGATAPPAEVQP